MFGLLLFLMSMHRPYVDVGFSIKPYMAGLALVAIAGFLRSIGMGTMRLRLTVPPFFLAIGVFLLACVLSAVPANSAARVFTLVAALVLCSIICLTLYWFAKRTPVERTLQLICRAGSALSIVSIAGYSLEITHVIPEMGFVFRGSPNLGQFGGAPRLVGLHLDTNYFAADTSLYLVVSSRQ